MTGTENDELSEKSYAPFIVNRGLSYFPDTIMYANEMNIHNHLNNKLQFHYLINTIRPKKRFSKWAKRKEDNDVDAIKEYYGYSRVKAEQALSILSSEQVKAIKKRLHKGGKNE